MTTIHSTGTVSDLIKHLKMLQKKNANIWRGQLDGSIRVLLKIEGKLITVEIVPPSIFEQIAR